jgi:hypothetical protein
MERAVSGRTDPHDPATVWTGRLTRGDAAGTVVGHLVDSWNWRVEITGTLDPEGGGYVLQGRLGPVPDSLRIEAIDALPDSGQTNKGGNT